MSNNNSTENPESIQAASDSAAIEDIRRMFVDEIQISRIVTEKQTPAKRAAFAKTHGIVSGTFHVNNDLPIRYQVGIFIPGKSYTAWVRYSSDIAQTAADLNSTVGVGIKLFDVIGRKAMDAESNDSTLDFILQNTEVFFASDAEDMANFKAAAMSGNLDSFLAKNPELAAVLDSMSKRVNTLLGEPMWSCVPFKFGNDFCKYKLHAKTLPKTDHTPNINGRDYLAADLAHRLSNNDIELDFYVQLRNNYATQSITDARNLWDERDAVPYKVATLILHRQNIKARQQQEYGESLSFNLWRTLLEMEPVGSIAEARKVVYKSSAMVRRNTNGQSIGEPNIPRDRQLAGHPIFTPSTETPWPTGTLSNAIEDFQSSGPRTVEPNYFITPFPEITISARDVQRSVAINHHGSLSNPAQMALMNKGITFVNFPHTSGTLRLLFELHDMSSVSFDLIMNNGNVGPDGTLTIKLFNKTGNVETLLKTFETGEITARITVKTDNGRAFNVLTFTNNNPVFVYNLQNFSMNYA